MADTINLTIPDIDDANIGTLPREQILPILTDIDEVSQCWGQLCRQKRTAKADLAASEAKLNEIKNEKPFFSIKLLFWILVVAGISFGVIPGVLVYVFLHQKMFDKDEQVRAQKAENNKQEAEKYENYTVIPLREKLEKIDEEINAINESGKIEWAKGVVGAELFESGSVGEIIRIITSRRADTLKEALVLYDSSEHRKRMENMQQGMLANSDTMAMESAKQTAIQTKIEKSARETATAAKWTAINTYRTNKTIQKADKDIRESARKSR